MNFSAKTMDGLKNQSAPPLFLCQESQSVSGSLYPRARGICAPFFIHSGSLPDTYLIGITADELENFLPVMGSPAAVRRDTRVLLTVNTLAQSGLLSHVSVQNSGYLLPVSLTTTHTLNQSSGQQIGAGGQLSSSQLGQCCLESLCVGHDLLIGHPVENLREKMPRFLHPAETPRGCRETFRSSSGSVGTLISRSATQNPGPLEVRPPLRGTENV